MDELSKPEFSCSEFAITEPEKISCWKRFKSWLFKLFLTTHTSSQKVDCISLELLKGYFLEPKRRQLLKDNKELLAVAIRGQNEDCSLFGTAAVYDKLKEEILNQENPITYMAPKMDAELENAFGNKDMIVLM